MTFVKNHFKKNTEKSSIAGNLSVDAVGCPQPFPSNVLRYLSDMFLLPCVDLSRADA